jgi:hypothetical protein
VVADKVRDLGQSEGARTELGEECDRGDCEYPLFSKLCDGAVMFLHSVAGEETCLVLTVNIFINLSGTTFRVHACK